MTRPKKKYRLAIWRQRCRQAIWLLTERERQCVCSVLEAVTGRTLLGASDLRGYHVAGQDGTLTLEPVDRVEDHL